MSRTREQQYLAKLGFLNNQIENKEITQEEYDSKVKELNDLTEIETKHKDKTAHWFYRPIN